MDRQDARQPATRGLWTDLLKRLVDTYPESGPAVASAEGRVFDRLDRLYGDQARGYHSWVHIRFCLELLESCSLKDDLAVRAALWFHDAVYEPARTDNEARSAAFASESLNEFRIPADFVEETHDLILSTAHLAGADSGGSPERACILDIDLAILGAGRGSFQAYERGIRKEYHHVADTVYRSRRIEVLRHFLSRPRIYLSEEFAARFEASARANIVWLIEQLKEE